MSEQNILNPSATDALNFDWGYTGEREDDTARFSTRSGQTYERVLSAEPHVYELLWNERERAVADQIRQWSEQYRGDYFTLADWERQRYFTGNFSGKPKITPIGNRRYNIAAVFREICGVPMYQYPANWGVDSRFIEECDAFGSDLVKLTGSSWWHRTGNSSAHGGSEYCANVADDTAEWNYFGYGFRVWSHTETGAGIVEISLDGAVVATVDLYTSAWLDSSPVYTKSNVSLGTHRVKLRVTGTKNASSGGIYIFADALEIML